MNKDIENILATLPEQQISKIKQIMDVISLKAASDNIVDSSDLLMKYIPKFSYEIVLPYGHFPEPLSPFDINNLIKKLAVDFGVINLVRLSSDNIVVRFPVYGNSEFKDLRKCINKNYPKILTLEKNTSDTANDENQKSKNSYLKSIHLITSSIAVKDAIFLVLDENFELPIRFNVKNKDGDEAYIKKLHNIAYIADVQNMRVAYDKNLADSINNGLFRRRQIKKYMATNHLKKPTLVQKSENGNILVLKNEVPVKTMLIHKVPTQHLSLYLDKNQ